MVEFKVGDLVQLKSGGPPMTVAEFPDPDERPRHFKAGQYRCVWFSGKKHESGWFPPETLEPGEPPTVKMG